MVFLVLTRSGYKDFLSLRSINPILWVSRGILNESELREARTNGIDVSEFTDEIHLTDIDRIQGAIETIKEHHPNESVWVES